MNKKQITEKEYSPKLDVLLAIGNAEHWIQEINKQISALLRSVEIVERNIKDAKKQAEKMEEYTKLHSIRS